MKFTQIPANTFSTLQLNAGLLLKSFDPKTATVDSSGIIGATSGGVKFQAKPGYTDFGEDIDNCPANMMELKRLDSIEVTMSGTLVTATASVVRQLAGAADVDTKDATHVVPRNSLSKKDFSDIWWVGDYSDKNGDKNGGYIAIHMSNSLSTGGFSLTSDNKKKGQMDFELTAHYSMDDPDKVPYEVYVKAGADEATEALA